MGHKIKPKCRRNLYLLPCPSVCMYVLSVFNYARDGIISLLNACRSWEHKKRIQVLWWIFKFLSPQGALKTSAPNRARTVTLKQGFGSGSGRISYFCLDPDPNFSDPDSDPVFYFFSGSGSGFSRSKKR